VRQYAFGSPEFDEAIRTATHQAWQETLDAGRPVFYLTQDGLELMQYPDGRKFEIRWIPGAPAGHNYEVIRELKSDAA